MKFVMLMLFTFPFSPLAISAEWTDVTGKEEITQITVLVESAIHGKEFSRTDDDTKMRIGRRYGTRHHMNSCTISATLSKAKIQKRGSFPRTEYRVECPCLVSGSYIRIEFGSGPDKKNDDALRQEGDLEIVLAPSGSSVKVLRQTDGHGSGDGRGRMMNSVPSILTSWITDELKNE